jgi:DNA-binding NarL/FixJ family response regulator
VVDEHAIFRMGLRALLNQEQGLTVVADAGSADEALQRLAEIPVDIIVTDLSLSGRSGLELLSELRTRFPGVRSLVLTSLSGDAYARSCLAAGAAGYALKSSSHAELLTAIRTVHAGQRFLCESVSARIVAGFLDNVETPLPSVRESLITPRERDILTRVARGQKNSRIADDMGLSVWTIRRHRQKLKKKYALDNTAAITAFAIGHGLVKADSNR